MTELNWIRSIFTFSFESKIDRESQQWWKMYKTHQSTNLQTYISICSINSHQTFTIFTVRSIQIFPNNNFKNKKNERKKKNSSWNPNHITKFYSRWDWIKQNLRSQHLGSTTWLSPNIDNTTHMNNNTRYLSTRTFPQGFIWHHHKKIPSENCEIYSKLPRSNIPQNLNWLL